MYLPEDPAFIDPPDVGVGTKPIPKTQTQIFFGCDCMVLTNFLKKGLLMDFFDTKAQFL